MIIEILLWVMVLANTAFAIVYFCYDKNRRYAMWAAGVVAALTFTIGGAIHHQLTGGLIGGACLLAAAFVVGCLPQRKL